MMLKPSDEELSDLENWLEFSMAARPSQLIQTVRKIVAIYKRSRLQETSLKCFHCEEPVSDWYMVHDAVWLEAVPNYRQRKAQGLHTFLCFKCLAMSLGRSLTLEDFQPDAKVNQGIFLGSRMPKTGVHVASGDLIGGQFYPSNGLVCSVCGSGQVTTPHGVTCRNGHGGVLGVPYVEYWSHERGDL